MKKVKNTNSDHLHDLIELYEKNKNNDPNTWLSLKHFFQRLGKQGVVGVFNVKDNKTSLVFKYSQYVNYLIQHEYTIGDSLNELNYCTHFPLTIGAINIPTNPKINHKVIKKAQKEGLKVNPFDISKIKYPIYKEVLLQEEICNAQKFSHFIKKKLLSTDQLYSIINQVLFAIKISHTVNFTHYDLHSDNIMIKQCDPNQINIYKFKDKAYFVPTHGYIPVIIDFGFSYAKSLENSYCWPSMGHTHAGFISDRFDPISDMKLFLLTTSTEIKEYNEHDVNAIKFRNIAKNIFAHLCVDNYNGWDDYIDVSASDSILDILSEVENDSELFDRYDYHIIDLLTSLIILPFEENSSKDIIPAFVAFISEFTKIEKEVNNDFYSLNVLKDIIQSVRNVRALYTSRKTREQAINIFRTDCFESVNTVSKYCTLKTVKWEKLLCGIICLAKNIEGLIYLQMKRLMDKKEKHLERMRLKTPEQVWECINYHIEIDTHVDENSKFILIDVEKQLRKEIYLDENELKDLNNVPWHKKGGYFM